MSHKVGIKSLQHFKNVTVFILECFYVIYFTYSAILDSLYGGQTIDQTCYKDLFRSYIGRTFFPEPYSRRSWFFDKTTKYAFAVDILCLKTACNCLFKFSATCFLMLSLLIHKNSHVLGAQNKSCSFSCFLVTCFLWNYTPKNILLVFP